MSLQSDLLLALSGVLNPKPFRPGDKEKSAHQLVIWERRLRRWLHGTRGEFTMADQNVERIRSQLRKVILPRTRAELTGIFTRDRRDIVEDYNNSLKQAREFLNLQYPLEAVRSVLGPEEMPASQDEMARWLAVVNVVDDPDFFITEVEAMTIEAGQVKALETTHPNLYNAIHSVMVDLLVEFRDKKGAVMSFEKEAILQILMQSRFEKTVEPAPPSPELPEETKGEEIDFAAQQAPTEKLLTPLQ